MPKRKSKRSKKGRDNSFKEKKRLPTEHIEYLVENTRYSKEEIK